MKDYYAACRYMKVSEPYEMNPRQTWTGTAMFDAYLAGAKHGRESTWSSHLWALATGIAVGFLWGFIL